MFRAGYVVTYLNLVQQNPTRPMVLICHCFGGIIIQRAIISARLHSQDWTVVPRSSTQDARDMVHCIAGIVFLGTPFRGSKAQTYAKIIGTIMSHLNDRGNSKIYDLTDAKSQEQKDQLHNFVHIAFHQAIPICCFYEQHKSDLTRILRAPKAISKKVNNHETGSIRQRGMCIMGT